MLRLTNLCRYAVGAVVYLAAQDQGEVVPSHHIAEAVGAPKLFLGKALRHLADAHLLRTMKGLKGGCRLARPGAEITLLEIVEAVDGPIRGGAGFPFKGEAKDLAERLQVVFDQVAATVRREWGKVKVSDLAGSPGRKGREK